MVGKKNVWLTGASSGIGKALAGELVSQGHFVIASGRNQNALDELKAKYPNHVETLAFDATSDADWESLPGRLAQVVDQLEMVVMAAGVCDYIDAPDADVEVYRKVFEVNFFAGVRTVNCALPFLERSDLTRQVAGVGSLSAQAAFTRAQAYGASKSALEYWLECQRLDLSAREISVTVISPGFVDTPMTEQNDFSMPGKISAEQAAQIIAQGLEDKKMYIRFPKRLYWPLRLARWVPGLWFGWLADKIQRRDDL
ncbi:SDR family oxidoreductase [Halioxenophilus aromaticivorans]|uniref:SDR family oxidoreductase n=1 Tax=Halioxenophilus aromaticivorans TaxID=1306992 RepID=A0AAV3TYZ9_9ALTE